MIENEDKQAWCQLGQTQEIDFVANRRFRGTAVKINPKKKADWIQSQIEKGYDDILFLDDSPKNVTAVKKLKQKYPKIKMDARVVNYG